MKTPVSETPVMTCHLLLYLKILVIVLFNFYPDVFPGTFHRKSTVSMIGPDSLKVYINLKWEAHHSWYYGGNLGKMGKTQKTYFKEPVKDEVFQLKFSGH